MAMGECEWQILTEREKNDEQHRKKKEKRMKLKEMAHNAPCWNFWVIVRAIFFGKLQWTRETAPRLIHIKSEQQNRKEKQI